LNAGTAIVICLAALMALCCISPLSAQDAPVRPKVGLALSGGGAKGLAHIGVLKVMEEAGLRPDIITGVSMGSIIGGIYAMGYSADSIAALFSRHDLELALSDRIPENKVIFLEKRHYYNSLVSLAITRKAIKIPSALINGQQIESALSHYFWPAACIDSFADLPIPFLCLATDLITVKKVILDKGYLPEAIRASIAIPSIFTAVRTDTAMLVDGGVLRNYAASELRERGADIVIGSYVGFKGYSEKDSESAYGILKQIGFLTSHADFQTQKLLTDILIEPDVKDIPLLSFNNLDSIIERGYRKALPYKERFAQIADSLNAMGTRKSVMPLPLIPYRTFDRIEVTGNQIISDEQIIGVLDIKPGQKVDRTLLGERIELLYGKNWFEKVVYRIIPRNDSVILSIDCIERPKGMLYGSLHYDNSLGSGVVLNISVRDLITPQSVINAESFIGENYRLRFSAMQFVDRSQKFGLEASLYMDKTRLPLIRLRDETGPMISRNLVTGISLSKRLSLNHLMNVNAMFENQNLTPDYLTAVDIKKLSYDYLRLTYNYEVNTLDYKHFPSHGISYCVTASAIKLLRGTIRTETGRDVYYPEDSTSFSFDKFYSARAWFRNYSSPSDRVTIGYGGEILFATGVDSITSNNNMFLLGGIDATTQRSVPAVGFHANQIAVQALAGLRFSVDVEVLDDLHLFADANLFAISEPDRDYGVGLLAGYGVGVGYMTVAGPLRAGIMHGLYNREIFFKQVKGYVSIGFSF